MHPTSGLQRSARRIRGAAGHPVSALLSLSAGRRREEVAQQVGTVHLAAAPCPSAVWHPGVRGGPLRAVSLPEPQCRSPQNSPCITFLKSHGHLSRGGSQDRLLNRKQASGQIWVLWGL